MVAVLVGALVGGVYSRDGRAWSPMEISEPIESLVLVYRRATKFGLVI